MNRLHHAWFLPLLALGCRGADNRTTAPKLYSSNEFTLTLPPGATVRKIERSNDPEIVIVSADKSSYSLFIAKYQVSDTESLRALVRREFINDSIESKRSDWGVPGPVKRDTVGGLEAWSFEPTCGDCTMSNIYVARGHTVLRFQCIYSENTAEWPRQRAIYSAILASFRWRGA